ncbi:MAG: hypothetical protein ACRER2_05035 [Methylococcales bacterium]
MPDFMFFRLAQTDDVEIIAALGIGHVHYGTVQPDQQVDAKFSIGFAVVVLAHLCGLLIAKLLIVGSQAQLFKK